MFKKIVINAAIVLMIVATLSGCGNNNVKNDKANEQNAEKITIQLNSSQSANSVGRTKRSADKRINRARVRYR